MDTININGRFLSQAMTGVQRYAAEIVRAWDEGLNEGWIDRRQFVIRVIAPRTILQAPSYKHIEVQCSLTNGKLWEQVELPWRARGTLLFSPYVAAPVLKKRHAVTIHDAATAAAPHQYSAAYRAYCFILLFGLKRFCEPIFTDSAFSKQELQRYFSIPAEKIKVVPLSCDHLLGIEPDPRILERTRLKRHQFVLGVSAQSVIKNFDGLVRAWMMLARPGMKLAIAGKANSRVYRTGNAAIDDTVVRLGYVTDGELRSLYENAALLAYPSFYEGFGLPPLEAMTCGCPVLVARSSALPEVCGDAAVYCDPADVSDIADKISQVLDDPGLANLLRQKGAAHAAQFTARNAASLLWSEILRSRFSTSFPLDLSDINPNERIGTKEIRAQELIASVQVTHELP
jgi:glycosyltransferase involved in cell wall biosynthesis